MHSQGRQPVAEGRRHAEGVVCGDPSGPQMAQLYCPLQHLQSQSRLRPVAPSLPRNPSRRTTVLVRGPALRQIKALVHQGPAQRAHVGQEHPRLAVGHLAQPAAVLPGHSRRLPTLLGKVAAVQDPHPLRMLQPGSQVLLQPPYNRVIVPGRVGEKPLHPPGGLRNRLR